MLKPVVAFEHAWFGAKAPSNCKFKLDVPAELCDCLLVRLAGRFRQNGESAALIDFGRSPNV
jgi:hypothetical protein